MTYAGSRIDRSATEPVLRAPKRGSWAGLPENGDARIPVPLGTQPKCPLEGPLAARGFTGGTFGHVDQGKLDFARGGVRPRRRLRTADLQIVDKEPVNSSRPHRLTSTLGRRIGSCSRAGPGWPETAAQPASPGNSIQGVVVIAYSLAELWERTEADKRTRIGLVVFVPGRAGAGPV